MSAERGERQAPTRPGEPSAPSPDEEKPEPAPAAAQETAEETTEAATEAAAEAGASGPGVESELESELESALRQRDEYLDMVRRVQADFENYKKRMLRQQTDLLERAAEALVVKMLPVLDAFELARAHLEAEGSPEGKALVAAAGLLSDTLAKEGLERFGDDGEVFDPATHEAVEHEPAAHPPAGGAPATEEPADAVVHHEPVVTAVLRPGYRYKGRVVRPAMVKVRG